MKSKADGVLREETFSDSSRLVELESGGWLIVESDLAACHLLSLACERPARYDAPTPPPQCQ
jgi:hypothetical protein